MSYSQVTDQPAQGYPGAYASPPPAYGAPPPGYGAPAPGYGAPPPGYGAPAPGYAAPGYPAGVPMYAPAPPTQYVMVGDARTVASGALLATHGLAIRQVGVRVRVGGVASLCHRLDSVVGPVPGCGKCGAVAARVYAAPACVADVVVAIVIDICRCVGRAGDAVG